MFLTVYIFNLNSKLKEKENKMIRRRIDPPLERS